MKICPIAARLGRLCRSLLPLLLLFPALSHADPQPGFGLALALAEHHADVSFNQAPFQVYNSHGAGLAGDAQFVINPNWSLDPYLEFAYEHSHGDVQTALINASGGLMLRHWWQNVYVGPALEYGGEGLLQNQTVSRSSFGPGVGVGLGYESPRGLTLGLQVDAPQALYFSRNQRRSGAWLTLGYRWH